MFVSFLLLELVCIATIALGIGLEVGAGWGLCVLGALGLGLVTVAQLPSKGES